MSCIYRKMTLKCGENILLSERKKKRIIKQCVVIKSIKLKEKKNWCAVLGMGQPEPHV